MLGSQPIVCCVGYVVELLMLHNHIYIGDIRCEKYISRFTRYVVDYGSVSKEKCVICWNVCIIGKFGFKICVANLRCTYCYSPPTWPLQFFA